MVDIRTAAFGSTPDLLFLNHRFMVEINGLPIAGFAEISGLEVSIETETISEGGCPFPYTIRTGVSYSDLTLKRGLGLIPFYSWVKDVAEGKTGRVDIIVHLLENIPGPIPLPTKTWMFLNAFPTKWSVSDLNSTDGEIVFEEITMAHHGFKQIL
ncbi:phage tail protein [Candidatus Uabimicrobium amorphum]|uniref:Phage tail protein n=1 Tax=Uabimicrobium amorphum TaxID=2596890 RepID=A0A5S9F740_UABAM|nr:phage tail protein [Candidatus Uabimicrobium amorphum]BBM87991.1 phage tail protein [Candidatus Uabimicrobium amorphum]